MIVYHIVSRWLSEIISFTHSIRVISVDALHGEPFKKCQKKELHLGAYYARLMLEVAVSNYGLVERPGSTIRRVRHPPFVVYGGSMKLLSVFVDESGELGN